jgi:hypothetical protein
VGHKGSWANLGLGCGLAALSPLLPRQEVTALPVLGLGKKEKEKEKDHTNSSSIE